MGRSEDSDDVTPTLIQSVQRALRLVEAVADLDERAQAKQLARSLGLSLSTTYHLLRTLTFEGYLERRDDGRYLLGPELTRVARAGAHQSLKLVEQERLWAMLILRKRQYSVRSCQ